MRLTLKFVNIHQVLLLQLLRRKSTLMCWGSAPSVVCFWLKGRKICSPVADLQASKYPIALFASLPNRSSPAEVRPCAGHRLTGAQRGVLLNEGLKSSG